jgi:hypothetical protein
MKKIIVIIIAAFSLLAGVTKTSAQAVGVSITVAPPELPVYVQPECPGDGYLWSPGYWAYDPDYGYYWVPGVWVLAPTVGFLWTPGYWGFGDGIYVWHAGYWGPHIGFYGGVHYGFGYYGSGFYGGRWEDGHFRYNTAVWSVNNNIHNTYVDKTVINNGGGRTSFNGPGGNTAKPTEAEQTAMKENHVQPTSAQVSHQRTASLDKSQRASVNGGKPTVAAKSSIGGKAFNSSGHDVAAAKASPAKTTTYTATAAHTSAPAHATTHTTTQTHASASHNTAPAHVATHATNQTHASASHNTAPTHVTTQHAPMQTHASAHYNQAPSARPQSMPHNNPQRIAPPQRQNPPSRPPSRGGVNMGGGGRGREH